MRDVLLHGWRMSASSRSGGLQLIAIMAQRLVRIICPKCKEPDKPPTAEIRAAGLRRRRQPTSCEAGGATIAIIPGIAAARESLKCGMNSAIRR